MKIKRTDFEYLSEHRKVFFFKKLMGLFSKKSEIPEESEPLPETDPALEAEVKQEAEAELQMLSDQVGIGAEPAPIMPQAPVEAPEPEPVEVQDAAPVSIPTPTPEVSPESAAQNELEVQAAAAEIQAMPEPIAPAPQPVAAPEVPTAGEIESMTKQVEAPEVVPEPEIATPIAPTEEKKPLITPGSEGHPDAVGEVTNPDPDPDTNPPSSVA